MARRFSLKFKLGLWMAVASLFFGGMAVASIYYLFNQSLVEQAEANLNIVTQEISKEIGSDFEIRLDITKNLAERDRIVNYMMQEERDFQDPEVLRVLSHANIEGQYSAIYILDKEGITLVSTDESFVKKNYGFRDYVKDALAGDEGMDTVVGATSGKLGFYFSQPIQDESGNILGALTMKLKPEIIYSLFDESTFLTEGLEHSYLYFLEKNGVIIYSNEEDRIYSGFNYLDQITLNKIEEEKRFPQVNTDFYVFDLPTSEWQVDEKGRVFKSVDLLDNERELVAVVPMKESDKFWIAAVVSEDVFYQESFRVSATIAGFILLVALIALILVILFIRRQLNPLNKLKEITNKVAKGDLNQRLEIKTNDEIEDLADSFNSMIQSLRKSRENIEKRVVERTGELEKLNKAMTGRELKMIELKKKIKELESADAKAVADKGKK